MNQNTGPAAIAVVGRADSPASEPQRAFLATRPDAATEWFAPRDLNDLEDAIEAGRFARVLFATPGDFLEAVWSGDIRPAEWRKAAVRVEFAAPVPNDVAAQVWAVVERYEAWHARRRRAAIVSALILSGIAIAAAFGVIWAVG